MLRLMHVEDDSDIREIARLGFLMAGGFEVLQCASGEEAVAKAPDFQPDVLLLDVMMPGMSGPAVLTALRAMPAFAETPAIFMTARLQSEEILALKALSAIEVLSKPFDPTQLGAQIHAALDAANVRIGT